MAPQAFPPYDTNYSLKSAAMVAERGETGLVLSLALPIFILVNAAIALMVILSLVALLRGKLIPR
ncbi:UNVERIFIED_ORG: hypothetical protein QE446_005100 [Rhizobium sp. SORGH_AS260]|uniref:hypothetical protein n=1 Tax=Agrobacterium sp. SORGH_AS_0440 TaxID=3041757 RepID=UPI0027814052|nr:hypothetical protein [Agrobacterium sp. SORGH_AS_0440]MDP9734957.1 hypothetical protein [Rhizobium sp. SORGH_AS_0285]MDP9757176.1 hypothetical protein [Rhizobium sp. SORGH_AS_0260]MDR6084085.1 hypothetical protein [Agrobacterium sp. SORGH_AS_0440]